MSWLSIGIKVIPKLLKSGGSALGKTVSATTSATKNTASVVGKTGKWVVTNPKKSMIIGSVGWAGLEKMKGNPDSLGTIVGKNMRTAANNTAEMARDVANGFVGKETVEDIKDTMKSTVNSVKETAKETKGILGGLGNTISGIANQMGGGISKISDVFSNIASGKMSGLGIAGLLASLYFIFGRSGIIGKISGTIAGMVILYLFSQQIDRNQSATPKIQDNINQDEERRSCMRR